ncbi:phage major capsid protein [Pediococcus inopinatus]|uniref:phage major capsid protein n=1 Tax=Pediococcus inopinatus TaxID=114090 RepID=UPI002B25827A|nr:phage major capsid protein [Pediococcus inopinatus]WPC19427.1 phage major capsid protein [Pediococcus inopinatus]
MTSLFELKKNVADIGDELSNKKEQLNKATADPKVPIETVRDLNKDVDSIEERLSIVTKQYKEADAAQEEKLRVQAKKQAHVDFTKADPKEKVTDATAELIRSTMEGKAAPAAVREALGDDDATKTGGQSFLPKTVSNDIIAEPFDTNKLRDLEQVTQITNLELPRVAFTIDDDDFVEDQAEGKELVEKGDTVTFGRNKTKIKAAMSETVLLGTNTALVQYTENALQSGLASKEKKVAFAATPKAGEEHMSFYDATEVKIPSVSGSTLFDAITNAVGDLNDAYQDSAQIVMRRQDYTKMIKELSNGSATLYQAQPEEVLGKPVTFIDAATTPIVGDFSYSQLNYDIASTQYEQWKDFDKGINYFQITAYFDHQIKLASAFRLATVDAGTTGK